MTYQEVYDKFMIEYDKATVTASYPSFTKYEICTFLDKAYLALIAQKLTGNNPRGIGFEGDVKAIHDLQGLISTFELSVRLYDGNGHPMSDFLHAYNVYPVLEVTDGILYILPSAQMYTHTSNNSVFTDLISSTTGYNLKNLADPNYGSFSANYTCKLVNLETASKSFVTDSNYPRVKHPLLFIDGDDGQASWLYVVLDPLELQRRNYGDDVVINTRIIQEPLSFFNTSSLLITSASIQINDEMVGELVNLAVTMALENIQSPRLQTKVQLNQLES